MNGNLQTFPKPTLIATQESKNSIGFDHCCLGLYFSMNLTDSQIVSADNNHFFHECYCPKNKVGVADFTKARGLVKF